MARSLVLLAAGVGSRFGGPKQLVPIGPHGETILDYNAHDAARAGFDRVVIVTRAELEADVRVVVDRGVATVVETKIALQDVPPGREKPLGTTDAVLAASTYLDGGFSVANADDLYGPNSFEVAAGHVREHGDAEAAVVGFKLGETLPPEGPVSRALLSAGPDGAVTRVVEVHGLEHTSAGWSPASVEGIGALTGDELVSLNLWCFPAAALAYFKRAVAEFVAGGANGEAYLPEVVADLITDGLLRVRLLESTERWAGMTNPEDVELVRAHAAARWPSPLWDY